MSEHSKINWSVKSVLSFIFSAFLTLMFSHRPAILTSIKSGWLGPLPPTVSSEQLCLFPVIVDPVCRFPTLPQGSCVAAQARFFEHISCCLGPGIFSMTPRDEVAPSSALLVLNGLQVANEKNELWNNDIVLESDVSQQFRSSVAQKNTVLL